MHRFDLCIIAACLVTVASVHAEDVAEHAAAEHFEKGVRPLLIEKCVECHSGMTPDGDLDLSKREGFTAGGMSGEVIDGTDLDFSLLYERLITTNEDSVMPPGEPLSKEEIQVFGDWIRAGSVWPESNPLESHTEAGSKTPEKHWAFEPILASVLPPVQDANWCWTAVDRYVLHQMESAGIKPVRDADPLTWLRRITIDLTGLPPTVERQEAFLVEQSPHRELQEIEWLLSSRAYAERQGRHWLDVARYADTSGDGTDTPIPEARYYRDWVIDAFDRDMPYDQFLIQQLAGDILASMNPDDPDAYRKTIATGFIALSRRFGNSKFAEMNQVIDDTIDTVGKSMMGLSLGCARCHHHKFDPVTTEDYYGLYGYFASTQYPHAGTEHQKDRSDMPEIKPSADLAVPYESTVAWAVADKDKATDVAVHLAGDPRRKGDVAPRGFLGFLTDAKANVSADGSGRLELARWIASSEHPLTARVMVNRIWQSHFGKGLVDNANDFGVQSPPPTHPRLLDFLASEFIDSGWSVKHIHRLIVTSHVNRLSSQSSPDQAAKDQANRLLWRFPRIRMDAETLRDSILAVSGRLERGDGGRHPFLPTEKLKYNQGRPFGEIFDHERRSVYLMTPRLNRHPMMALFDGADANVTTGSRGESTVPLQSLFVMNGDFVQKQASAFANRLIDSSPDVDQRIDLAWKLTFNRSPDSDELDSIRQYVESFDSYPDSNEAWTSIAKILIGSNEFIFID